MVRLISALYRDIMSFHDEYYAALMARVSSPAFVPGGYTPSPSWGTFAITPDVLYTIFAAGIHCDMYFALFSPDDPKINILYSHNRELKLYRANYADLGRLSSVDFGDGFWDLDYVSEYCFSSEFAPFCDLIAPLFTAERYTLLLT